MGIFQFKPYYLSFLFILLHCTSPSDKPGTETDQDVVDSSAENGRLPGASEINTIREAGSNQLGGSWDYLVGKRWYVLLKDAADGRRKYIEPSCLSTTGLLEFYGKKSIEKLLVGAGQDALYYKVQSTKKSETSLTIELAKMSLGEPSPGPTEEMVITKWESEGSSGRTTISVKIDDVNDLLLGYYPDSIVALNQEALVYIADENDLFPYLRDQALFSKLPCEEEEEY